MKRSKGGIKRKLKGKKVIYMDNKEIIAKNAESVRKICEILGYRLLVFNPNWTLIPIDERLPKSLTEALANQMLGYYETIPDNFMGRIALAMGFDWEFQLQDDELRTMINQQNGFVKDIEDDINYQREIINKIATDNDDDRLKEQIKDLEIDQENYIGQMRAQRDKKIETFTTMIQLREKLRGWKADK